MLKVQQWHKAHGEDLDGEYLEGLYETAAASERDLNNPMLYFKVFETTKSALKRVKDPSSQDKLSQTKTPIFARADAVETAEALESREEEKRNVQQILAQDMDLYDSEEGGPYKATAFAEAQKWLMGGGKPGTHEATRLLNEIVGSALTGGMVEDGGQGGYGSIEFRFAYEEGELYLDKRFKKTFDEHFAKEHPTVALMAVEAEEVDYFKNIYLQAELPYPKERTGEHYVFVESDLATKFRDALEQVGTEGGVKSQRSTVGIGAAAMGPALPVAPLVTPKKREKTYTRRAVRGSRDKGQKAAMSDYSAQAYIRRFNTAAAEAHSWEWLHIQGARLGGPNRAENLVAGTDKANSQMIPYERAIYRLSTLANEDKPVHVEWTAKVRQDPSSNNTHIGDTIEMTVDFPKGPPADTEEHKAGELKGIFPVTVNSLEGAAFTKWDRDLIDIRAK